MTRDTDLVPAVLEARALGVKVVIAKPPLGTGRSEGAGDALVQASGNRPFHVKRSLYAQSQFPDQVVSAAGERFTKPSEWSLKAD